MGPTIRQWRLGVELRRLRERAKLTQDQVVAEIGMSRKTLHRLESGSIPKVRDLRTLLQLYNATKDELADLEQMARQAKERGWWSDESYSGAFSPVMSSYVSLEESAKRVRRWVSTGIHGLLQTPDYARTVEAGEGSSTALIESRVRLRLERQERAFARGVELWTLMDEAVLHRVAGDHTVMAWQLRHLIELANDPAKNLRLQVLPFASGSALLFQADFTIFDLPDGEQFAADDGSFGMTFYDRPERISSFNMTFGALTSKALTPRASVELIEAIAKEHEQRGQGA